MIAIESQPDIEDLSLVADELRRIIDAMLKGTDMRVQFSGVAFLRLEIVSSLMRDQQTFIGAGFLIVLTISWLFFHRLSYVFVAAFPAAIAVTWLAGVVVLRGTKVDVMSGVVPALVIVLVVGKFGSICCSR